jgi:hypothetical protein
MGDEGIYIPLQQTGYVKLIATQHNIPRDENHNYCRILSSHLFSLGDKIQEIFKL